MNSVLIPALMVIGTLFVLVSGVGLVRLPDVYCRAHAVTKASTLGLLCLLLSACLYFGTSEIITKAVLIILFVFVTNPVGTHMITRAALESGIRPVGTDYRTRGRRHPCAD